MLHIAHVAIMADVSSSISIGVAMVLPIRAWAHRMKLVEGFNRRYNVAMLVYVETLAYRTDAAPRKQELKVWRREKKVELIESMNPDWRDLAAVSYDRFCFADLLNRR